MISCVLLFVTTWIVAHQVPLSVEFCRQEYWSGLPFSTPGNLPHPGIEPVPPALAGGLFTTSVTWGDLSSQHKHNHFNTFLYVCVFEPIDKQKNKKFLRIKYLNQRYPTNNQARFLYIRLKARYYINRQHLFRTQVLTWWGPVHIVQSGRSNMLQLYKAA